MTPLAGNYILAFQTKALFLCNMLAAIQTGTMADGFFASALKAIPAAASSKLAFGAYTLALLTYSATAYRVIRNNNLLNHLQKLPAKDRLGALELEMSGVRLATGLTPEQWLRSRTHRYYFLSLAMTCVTALLIIIVAIVHGRGSVALSMDLYQKPPSENSYTHDVAPVRNETQEAQSKANIQSGTASTKQVRLEPKSSRSSIHASHSHKSAASSLDLYRVTYDTQMQNGISHVSYRLPYLDLVAAGGPVKATREEFKWDYPEISVKVVNNTPDDLLLTNAVVTISSSDINLDPILLVSDSSLNSKLTIMNYGWGEVVDPVVQFLLRETPFPYFPDLTGGLHSVTLKTFAEHSTINLDPYIPEQMRSRNKLFVAGNITYGSAYHRKVLNFTATVWPLLTGQFEYLPPSVTYDFMFEAGQAPAVKILPLSQEIKAGTADHFLIRLVTNKSSQTQLSIAFTTATGTVIGSGNFLVNIFAPRKF